MGSLYERLLGQHPTQPRVGVHTFESALAEWARGRITGPQAQAIIQADSGEQLDAVGIQEAQDIVSTVPTGSTTAQQAARALKIQELSQVFLLVSARAPGYDTPEALRTRLGVPTR